MTMNAVVSHVKTLVSTHRGLIIVLVQVDTGSCPTDNVKVYTDISVHLTGFITMYAQIYCDKHYKICLLFDP